MGFIGWGHTVTASHTIRIELSVTQSTLRSASGVSGMWSLETYNDKKVGSVGKLLAHGTNKYIILLARNHNHIHTHTKEEQQEQKNRPCCTVPLASSVGTKPPATRTRGIFCGHTVKKRCK
jgi:hypothetical protein